MKSISQLTKKALDQKRKGLLETLKVVNAQLEKIENKITIPKLRKKYEGRYFIYENAGGGEKWYMYIHCRKVVNGTTGIFDSFESCPINRNEHVFNYSQYNSFSFCEHEITKVNYMAAFNSFRKHLEKLQKK